jgi:Cu-Zn family superoxide dismutase
MKRVMFLAWGALLLSTLAAERADAAMTKVELKNAQGESIGTATLEAMPDGVKVVLQAAKLAPGQHGLHIHAVGKCTPPDFTSAASHFNPEGKHHGLENPAGPHAGDLPDLVVGPDGTATAEILATHVSLESTGANSLFQPEGTALVIHANPDDQKTDPAGNAGARIACGVITK